MIKKSFIVGMVIHFFFLSLYASLSYPLPELSVSVRNEGGIAVFEGMGIENEPGEPRLPVYTRCFLLPPNADLKTVSIAIEGVSEEILDGEYEVAPGAPWRTQNKDLWPEGKTIVDGKDAAIYNVNSFFPSNYAKIITAGMMREYKIVTVALYPFQYNPVLKRLKRVWGGELILNYSSGNIIENPVYTMPSRTTKLAKMLVENYNETGSLYARFETRGSDQERGLAIITTDEIKSGSKKFQDYIDSKEKKGYKIHIQTKSRWSAEQIRSWLKENYKALKLEYVVLIGNPDPSKGDVPMKNSSKVPTDWYYNELSGNDISSSDVLAELHVGRIPVYGSGDIQKLDKILAKTIAYENARKDEIGWRFKVLLAMKPIDEKTQAYELGEQIKQHTLIPAKWKYYRVYEKNYGLTRIFHALILGGDFDQFVVPTAPL